MHTLTTALLKLFGLEPSNHIWEVCVDAYSGSVRDLVEGDDMIKRLGIISVIGNRQKALARAREMYPEYQYDLFIRPYTGERDESTG